MAVDLLQRSLDCM